jgi:hypothetical protein
MAWRGPPSPSPSPDTRHPLSLQVPDSPLSTASDPLLLPPQVLDSPFSDLERLALELVDRVRGEGYTVRRGHSPLTTHHSCAHRVRASSPPFPFQHTTLCLSLAGAGPGGLCRHQAHPALGKPPATPTPTLTALDTATDPPPPSAGAEAGGLRPALQGHEAHPQRGTVLHPGAVRARSAGRLHHPPALGGTARAGGGEGQCQCQCQCQSARAERPTASSPTHALTRTHSPTHPLDFPFLAFTHSCPPSLPPSLPPPTLCPLSTAGTRASAWWRATTTARATSSPWTLPASSSPTRCR